MTREKRAQRPSPAPSWQVAGGQWLHQQQTLCLDREDALRCLVILQGLGMYKRRPTFFNANLCVSAHPDSGVKEVFLALAGVAQRTEHWPVNQRVAGSIPSHGTSLGCGPGPQ